MSSFHINVVSINDIVVHPNADRLEIAMILGFEVVVAKGQYHKGDLVAYIPEASIVPDNVAEHIGLLGKLAGNKSNRVKIACLRGVYSQGILYPISKNEDTELHYLTDPSGNSHVVKLGDDVVDILGIEKYRVEVPPLFFGEIFPIDLTERVNFDIENIKNFPDIILDGEEVVFTEKLHGTFTQVIYLPPSYIKREDINYPDTFQNENGLVMVSSKEQSHKGFMFKKEGETSDKNIYIKVIIDNDLLNKMGERFKEYQYPVVMLAETFGTYVQDLEYGILKGEKKGFRVFAIYTKEDGNRFIAVDSSILDSMLSDMKIERVPVLYKGPFSKEIMLKYTSGKESVSGKEKHIREGIVITPAKERYHMRLGRVILKSISVDYLMRKGGTEFN